MANLKCKAGDIPKFLLILHGLPRNMENMLNINRQRPEPRLELAYALDETSRPMIQNSISVPQTIAILLDQHDHSIFGYLKFARSLGQNAQYYPRHGSLSGDQFRAVWALKDHADEEIKTWLKQARDLGNAENSDNPLTSTLPESSNASGGHPHQTLDKTNISYGATKAASVYWCTLCEDRRFYKNLSDWKKHEKSHVETYVCMSGGALEETGGNSRCTLCGTSNPSEEHLRAHNIHTCGTGIPGSFFCKRRTDLVKHLQKRHNIQRKAQGEAIADQWKETIKKQAWSCGFCVHPFHTFGDRLKHIAIHFERGQTLDEWDTTKVMEGLLLQPGMVSAWKTQLAASFMPWESPEIIWEKPLVKDVQRDLEVGPSDVKDAATLAKRAYEARKSNWDLFSDDPKAIVPASDYNSIMGPQFQADSNHGPSQSVANPAETLDYSLSGLGEIPIATEDYSTFSAFSPNGWH